MQTINIHGARVHNLKSVDVEIPKNKLIVITGPSGSGKSSLAFDTIYTEGQRRYIESLSSYARQFLGVFSPPDVDSIEGLSPAIAIDQKTTSRNPRSTVGTITEIYDYLRVLFARIGRLTDPVTGEHIVKYTPFSATKFVSSFPSGKKSYISFPLLFVSSKETKKSFDLFQKLGFIRAFINSKEIVLEEIDSNSFSEKDEIYIIVDRFVSKPNISERLSNSFEHAFKYGKGQAFLHIDDKVIALNEKLIIPSLDLQINDIEPQIFSFNSPVGACEKCKGLGISKEIDLDKLVFDSHLPLLEGAIPIVSRKNNFMHQMIIDMAKSENINIDRPFKALPKGFLNKLFNGSDKIYKYKFESENSKFEFQKTFSGILPWLEKKYIETGSEKRRNELNALMHEATCSLCNGKRLNQIALNVKIADLNIQDVCQLQLDKCRHLINHLSLNNEEQIISKKLVHEIEQRLKFLIDTGLDYLTLNRGAATLSGGEGQRIRLATQIGSSLSGVIYVLDEPSIGLHSRDNFRLIQTLKSLRDLGNTVIVVEHDVETMANADFIIDFGPGAGIHGGEIIVAGNLSTVKKCKISITGNFLSGNYKIPTPKWRQRSDKSINIKGGYKHNIKNIDVSIPLSNLVCISGVSGSGKSTLLEDILLPGLEKHFKRVEFHGKAPFNSITGLNNISNYILLDQSPIGRTPHSNPATYSGIFDDIRTIFSKLPDSRANGYGPGRFSFNVKGGRCEDCEGNGVKKIEMHFLPDVYITCSSCNGTRYNDDTLKIRFQGRNVSEILETSIQDAIDIFKNHQKIYRTLSTLSEIGLGYIKLGQPATTLSGGEAQRLKLGRELSKRTVGSVLYILDEPTTGLHINDVKVLLEALNRLVDQGHSVVVIEHNLDVIKCSDYIIDLGPGGGENGGKIIATGDPLAISKVSESETGKYLKPLLEVSK